MTLYLHDRISFEGCSDDLRLVHADGRGQEIDVLRGRVVVLGHHLSGLQLKVVPAKDLSGLQLKVVPAKDLSGLQLEVAPAKDLSGFHLKVVPAKDLTGLHLKVVLGNYLSWLHLKVVLDWSGPGFVGLVDGGQHASRG